MMGKGVRKTNYFNICTFMCLFIYLCIYIFLHIYLHTYIFIYTQGFSCSVQCVILVSGPGLEPMSPDLQGRFPNHWTTREVP